MFRKHPILMFFLVAILFSWAGWIPYAASQAGLISYPIPAEIVWLAEFGPTLAAILLIGMNAGWSGIRDLLGRLLKWKVGLQWYAFALLLTPVLVMTAVGIDSIWRGIAPDFTLLKDWDIRFTERTKAFTPSMGLISGLTDFMTTGPVAVAIVLITLSITNGGLSEELGWRGFALPKLQSSGYSALTAGILVGILWSLWHTGTVFWKVVLTSNFNEGALFAAQYLLEYLSLVIPLAIIYASLYNNTGGSLLLAVLLHASYNLTVTLFTSAWPEFPGVLFLILIWLFAIALIVRFGPGSLEKKVPSGS